MARSPARLAVDAGFAAAIVACAIIAYAGDTPAIPTSVCEGAARAPDYAALYADGRLTVAAVFGEIEGAGPRDPAAWSADVLDGAGIAVDVFGPFARDDRADIDAALAYALAHYDVVYYNGHDTTSCARRRPMAGYQSWSSIRAGRRSIQRATRRPRTTSSATPSARSGRSSRSPTRRPPARADWRALVADEPLAEREDACFTEA